MPEWPLPFWLKATTLNSREQPATVVFSTAVVCKKSNRKKNKIPCTTICHYPDCLLGLVGGISPPRPFIVLVYKKRTWGVIGPYLKSKKGAVGDRIALLRANWSARGRELDEIKHST